MELYKEFSFDTDLDDDETDRRNDCILPRLSFDQKLVAHRSNRLGHTFGQINFSYQSSKYIRSNDETLLSLPNKFLSNNGIIQSYENSCQMLDISIDSQLRALLPSNNINIMNRSFSFNDIRAFATAMEANLESLTLSSVGLTTRSMNVLCQGLNKCINLSFLDLSFNKLDKQGFEILVDRINQLTSLTFLSVADCGIRDSYGQCIGDLCRHKTLTEINLSGNEFEEMACIFIGNALTDNKSLTCLNLNWNLIRSFASIALFRGFEVNTTLTDFDVSWSNLGYDGSVALRRILAMNKVLQYLNISNCNIDWSCAKLIGEGLQKNSVLHTLNLAFNPLTTHGVQHIIQSIDNPKSGLSTLDISGTAVFSGTVRLAEKIASERHFIMKFDIEIPVPDMIGRQIVTKADSVRTIIQQIDEKHWRPLDYFRFLNSKRKLKAASHNNSQHLADESDQPLTLKSLNEILNRQRMHDRLQKTREEQQEKDLKKRNQKILQTVNQHFPDIDTASKRAKNKAVIANLAKPRMSTEKK
ncbi:unnamed protein product [Adineta steineri]|uniref:Uncharacterized protein n=1 Tax=Adineta steineri TaxID=433720 RepID=A0A818WBQ0_9BILA|nr:unnamed protein product [Adineta steineri]